MEKWREITVDNVFLHLVLFSLTNLAFLYCYFSICFAFSRLSRKKVELVFFSDIASVYFSH